MRPSRAGGTRSRHERGVRERGGADPLGASETGGCGVDRRRAVRRAVVARRGRPRRSRRTRPWRADTLGPRPRRVAYSAGGSGDRPAHRRAARPDRRHRASRTGVDPTLRRPARSRLPARPAGFCARASGERTEASRPRSAGALHQRGSAASHRRPARSAGPAVAVGDFAYRWGTERDGVDRRRDRRGGRGHRGARHRCLDDPSGPRRVPLGELRAGRGARRRVRSRDARRRHRGSSGR